MLKGVLNLKPMEGNISLCRTQPLEQLLWLAIEQAWVIVTTKNICSYVIKANNMAMKHNAAGYPLIAYRGQKLIYDYLLRDT